MIYDIHSHVIFNPKNSHNYLCPKNKMSFGLRLLNQKMHNIIQEDAPENTLVKWINESKIDRVVLLALDGVFLESGSSDFKNTKIIINNDFVYTLANQSSKILFGASIHPYRKDAINEIRRVAKAGACLMKWIPSAQNIDLKNKKCFEFYEVLAEYKIPLLTHIGIEHTLPTFKHQLNDPRLLIPALERGVTVIGAHCGTQMLLHEKCYFKHWIQMAYDYENFYGDISTFTSPLHHFPLKKIMNDKILFSKILYGSDFPAISWPLWYSPTIGFKNALDINRIKNPFDKSYLLMKAMGVTEEVFSRAEKILKLETSSVAVSI